MKRYIEGAFAPFGGELNNIKLSLYSVRTSKSGMRGKTILYVKQDTEKLLLKSYQVFCPSLMKMALARGAVECISNFYNVQTDVVFSSRNIARIEDLNSSVFPKDSKKHF